MARFMVAAEWRAQAVKWGLQAKYYPGWETRTRPGDHSDARGIMKHHTGSDSGQSDDYNYFLFVKGRPEDGIPGPLANSSTDMDGDCIIGATGRANHAGMGSKQTLDLVTAGKAPLNGEIKPGPDGINGNSFYYGDEVKYDGGQPMAALQRRTSLIHDAMICDFHDWNAGHVIGHREHTGRKIDPGNNPMGVYRTDLAEILRTGPGITVAKDVTITAYCINRVVRDALGVSGECLIDNYQLMNIAVWFYPLMAETTRPAMWLAVKQGDWRRVRELQQYALKVIQSNAGIAQTGQFDTATRAFLRTRGYIIL